ncbi:hypothetical protein [Peribacillus deserti]|uniref:Uncharacterized protein n=1 Tax=Peribacillus deserti TaxID=673318 RepID=A0A2N5M1D1_9BACI|nr:hypothetical protein [Peribacillus deserti]PLT28176.1 hypothetical protein CUU66_19730 [Peribacillus deserti]
MKNDTFMRVILSGIFVCLAIIVFKLNSDEPTHLPTPNVEVDNQGGRVVQIAPNRVGVVDTGSGSGWEQLVIFEYNEAAKKFEVVSSFLMRMYLTTLRKMGFQ